MPKRFNLSCDGYYHIIQKATADTFLFYNDENRLKFLGLLKELTTKYEIDVCAFVLMNNHVHLLVKTYDFNLSKPMKFLFQSYAIYLNQTRKRQGCVFKGRFFSEVIRDPLYLLVCSLYIHLNPSQAKMVNNPLDFKWSSILTYVDHHDSFLKVDHVLKKIDSVDCHRAMSIYENLILENRKLNLNNSVENKFELEEFFHDFILDLDNSDSIIDNIYKDSLVDKLSIARSITQCVQTKRFIEPSQKQLLYDVTKYFMDKGYSIKLIAKRLGRSKRSMARLAKQVSVTHNGTVVSRT